MPSSFPLLDYNESEAPVLPVLMYHNPSINLLKKHFQLIQSRGYTPVHLSEVAEYFTNPLSAPFPNLKIVLTFDDAYQDFYNSTFPLLKNLGLKSTVCVPTRDVLNYNSVPRPVPVWAAQRGPLMTWNELKELRKVKTKENEDLIEFIPHSVTHRYFNELEETGNPETEFQYEVSASKKKLSEELEIDFASIRFYCLPGGTGEGKEIVEKILNKNNYLGALRAQYKKGDRWSQYRIPRCEPFTQGDLIRLLSKGGFSCC
jgi:peptidoglycan/xylan/chitin deacetylase (PgdA/CDA1 family)